MQTTSPRLTLSRQYAMPVAVLVLFNVLHLAGFKTFDPWSQVTLLWGGGVGMLEYIYHFHFYRLMVASPGLWLEDAFPNHGFSAYISVYLAVSTLYFAKLHKLVSGRRPQIWAWGLFLAILLLMNGRGAIGWAGWLLSVHACLGVTAGQWPGLAMRPVLQCILGLTLTVVSSGIFVGSLAVLGYFIFIRGATRRTWTLRRFSAARLPGLVLVFVLLPVATYFVFNYLADAVSKVMLFYGYGLEGLIGIATHGFAAQIDKITTIHVIAAGIMLLLLILFLLSDLPERIGKDVVVIILIALGGGAFGLIILTLAFPLIIIAMAKLLRFRVSRGATG